MTKMSDKLNKLLYGEYRDDIAEARSQGENDASYEGGLTVEQYREKIDRCYREANSLLDVENVTVERELEAAMLVGFVDGYELLIDVGYEAIHGYPFGG